MLYADFSLYLTLYMMDDQKVTRTFYCLKSNYLIFNIFIPPLRSSPHLILYTYVVSSLKNIVKTSF